MKRSEFKDYIREEIISVLSEAGRKDLPNTTRSK